jgi:hypothetical protein
MAPEDAGAKGEMLCCGAPHRLRCTVDGLEYGATCKEPDEDVDYLDYWDLMGALLSMQPGATAVRVETRERTPPPWLPIGLLSMSGRRLRVHASGREVLSLRFREFPAPPHLAQSARELARLTRKLRGGVDAVVTWEPSGVRKPARLEA